MDLNRLNNCWFALQVKPKYELLVETSLHNKGFEGFAPTYVCTREWSDRKKHITLPLFPGYVFCRFNTEVRAPIVSTPGVIRILGNDSAIPDGEIEAIRTVVSKGIASRPCSYLDVGTRVQIITGPLTGVTGILVSHTNLHRLILSVTLVRGSISIQIERGSVIPVRENGRTKPVLFGKTASGPGGHKSL